MPRTGKALRTGIIHSQNTMVENKTGVTITAHVPVRQAIFDDSLSAGCETLRIFH